MSLTCVCTLSFVFDDVICADECTPTVTNATSCAVVQSAVYLTATIGHDEEVRFNALSIIQEKGSYEYE